MLIPEVTGTTRIPPSPMLSLAAPMSTSEPRRATILAVDDEPAVLAAVARDLRRGFGEHYRILRAGSGAEALELLDEMRRARRERWR